MTSKRPRTWHEKEQIRRVQELRRSSAATPKAGKVQNERRKPKYPLKKTWHEDD